ncbi:MAG: tetratricopeptide repeat protein [Proteobacteria bacterium]|nr:tetratricopeptide repeat protein [Pseudomonadota bacterium]
MSLLADLLSKVKYQKHEGGIPPTLKRVISDSKKKRVVKKQIVIMGSLALIMVFIGLGVVYYINVLTVPSLAPRMARTNIQDPLQPQKIELNKLDPHLTSVDKIIDKQVEKPEASHTGRAETTVPQKTVKAYPVPLRQKESEGSFSSEKKYLSSRTIAKSEDDATKLSKELTALRKAERDGFLYTAKNYEAGRDYHHALNYYKKALEIDQRNYVIMNNIASLLINMGLYEEAIKYSKNVLSINKNYAPSLVNIGISFVQLGNTSEGKIYLLQAGSLEPSNNNVLLNLALLYEKNKDYDEANKMYSKLYQMEDIQGYLGIARIAEGTSRPDDAKKVYREIMALNNVDSKIKKIVSERLLTLESR